MADRDRKTVTSTVLGLLTLLIWSTSFAFARSIQDQAGPLFGAACIYLLGGGLGCVHMLVIQRRGGQFLRMPRGYLLVCGGLFITYIVAVQVGIGFAPDRRQAVGVIITNYLWPGLTMALSVPLLGRRARWFLVPGVLLGMVGVLLGVMYGAGLSVPIAMENLRTHPLPYVLGLVAGVSWALYSNLSRRLAGPAQVSGVPIFLLLSGGLLGVMHLFSSEQPHWTRRALLELAYAAVFPSLLAYSFWEVAMRYGRISVIVPVSYFTPLLATIISCLYLGVPMGLGLWLACGLVVVGAILSSRAVSELMPAEASNASNKISTASAAVNRVRCT